MVDGTATACQFSPWQVSAEMYMPQERKKLKPLKNRDDASLYPLDPEMAIKAILETGPHPRNDTIANQKRRKPNRGKAQS
jgi:hypothetical protein